MSIPVRHPIPEGDESLAANFPNPYCTCLAKHTPGSLVYAAHVKPFLDPKAEAAAVAETGRAFEAMGRPTLPPPDMDLIDTLTEGADPEAPVVLEQPYIHDNTFRAIEVVDYVEPEPVHHRRSLVQRIAGAFGLHW